MPSGHKKTPDFETAIAELEGIVSVMETGKISLDESLKRYERGMELLAVCNGILQSAEQRIAILDNDRIPDSNGMPSESDLNEEDH